MKLWLLAYFVNENQIIFCVIIFFFGFCYTNNRQSCENYKRFFKSDCYLKKVLVKGIYQQNFVQKSITVCLEHGKEFSKLLLNCLFWSNVHRRLCLGV